MSRNLILAVSTFFFLLVDGRPPIITTEDPVDVVVVGAGASGGVFARKLWDRAPKTQITVLEAGGALLECSSHNDYSYTDLTIWDVPGEYTNIAFNNAQSRFPSSAFTYLGFGVGGSSAVNGALYQRPSKKHFFDKLPEEFSEQSLEKHYLETEAFLGWTSTPSMDGKRWAGSTADFFEGTLKSWKNDTKQWHEGDMTGLTSSSRDHLFSQPPVNTRNGQRRCSAHYLCGQHNITITTGAMVEHIVMDPNGTATGVVYKKDGGIVLLPLLPSGVVVMAAGALQTPKILWQSGIGSLQALSDMEAGGLLNPKAPRFEAPFLGEYVQDHTLTSVVFSHPNVSTWIPDDSPQVQKDRQRFTSNRTGPFTQYGPTCIAHIESPYADHGQSDIEFFLGPEKVTADKHSFRIWSVLLNPTSKSPFKVYWNTSEPTVAWDIDGCGPKKCQLGDVRNPGGSYLNNTHDQNVMIWATTRILDMVKNVYPNITILSPWKTDKQGIRDHVLSSGNSPGISRASMNHFTGTAPLATAVDPATLRVLYSKSRATTRDRDTLHSQTEKTEKTGKGAKKSEKSGKNSDSKVGLVPLSNVHVIDASLLPVPVPVHPVATNYAMASRAADLVFDFLRMSE